MNPIAGKDQKGMNLIDPAQNLLKPEKPEKRWKTILAKIWGIVRKILLVLANAACFFVNPTLYPLAFLAGFVWSEHVQKVIDKILTLWKKHPWVMTPLTVVAGFLSIQVTVAAVSALFAAHLGATLSKVAENSSQTVKNGKTNRFSLF